MSRRSMREIMEGVTHTTLPRPRIIANNTIRYTRPDGTVVVRLHDTDIISVAPDGAVTLDSGGWRTVTTKARFDQFAPRVRVWSVKGVWMCGRAFPWVPRWNSQGRKLRPTPVRAVPFHDGIQFTKGGRCLNPILGESARQRHLAGAINKFARQVLDADQWPTLPAPGGGDCWHCSMFNQVRPNETRKRGESWAEVGQDRAAPTSDNHLMNHIGLGENPEEDYLHGWLILNAMRWAGYQDMGIGMMAFSDRPSRDTVARALRRYLRFQLGLSV